jgi:hypothetical protein
VLEPWQLGMALSCGPTKPNDRWIAVGEAICERLTDRLGDGQEGYKA